MTAPRPPPADAPPPGPLDRAPWPEKLTAYTVSPGARPLLCGYDVEADLARHYGPVDLWLLALTGELPEPAQALAAQAALCFLGPQSVAEAPVHAAVVAHLCSVRHSALLAVAASALAEQAQSLVGRHEGLYRWLASGTGEPPPEALAATEEDRLAADRLRTAVQGSGLAVPALAFPLSREAAALAVLAACGAASPEAAATLLVGVRLPLAVAEAQRQAPLKFPEYPADLPHFEYRQEAPDEEPSP